MESKYVPTPWAVGGKTKRYGIPVIEIISNHVENGISYSGLGPVALVVGHHEEAEETAIQIVRCANVHDELAKALQIIANWKLPVTGNFWDKDQKEPMSYETCYGSNGVRDYMKSIAKEALKKVTDTSIEKQPK